MPDQRIDIVVAGAGPVGMVVALTLSAGGWRIALAGPQPVDDRRTTALMAPALATLARLGLLDSIEAVAAPLRTMRIVDGSSRLIRSPVVTFRASEIGEERFGLNIPNAALNAILADAVAAAPGVVRHDALVDAWRLDEDGVEATLADGTMLAAPLAVAADGRRSALRDAAGIEVRMSTLPQSALVLTFAHTRDHGFISTEYHTETGPFTQVPLPGMRSSLVWVLTPADAEAFAGLSDEALALRVEARMQSMLGKVTVEPGRQVYPLTSAMPRRFAHRRVALAGEAAHVFPPIGAQGLNLGLRDADDLDAALADHRDDPGSAPALAAYERRRRPDVLSRATAVNLLNRSLLTDFLPVQMARAAGLSVLGAVPPLRALFMREGMRPGSGLAALRSGEQVRR